MFQPSDTGLIEKVSPFRALEVDPRSVHTLRSLGKLLLDQGRPEEARRLWERLKN